MSGIPVWRKALDDWPFGFEFTAIPAAGRDSADGSTDEPGTWFPLAEAEALERVIEAARVWSNSGDDDLAAQQGIDRALDDLAALRSKS